MDRGTGMASLRGEKGLAGLGKEWRAGRTTLWPDTQEDCDSSGRPNVVRHNDWAGETVTSGGHRRRQRASGTLRSRGFILSSAGGS